MFLKNLFLLSNHLQLLASNPLTRKGIVTLLMRVSVSEVVLDVINMNALFVLSLTPWLGASKNPVPIAYRGIFFPRACTPVRLENMLHWLSIYPDKGRASLLTEGFRDGFPIPFFSGIGCQPVKNLRSVDRFSDIVRERILKEIREGQVAGQGALQAKADIKSMFRLLPISPLSFNSFGFCFDDLYFIDMCLPMGCSLPCAYFESFASFLQWVVSYESGFDSIVHYLDDFLFVGPAGSPLYSYLLQLFSSISAFFGIPLAVEKTILPLISLEFLGITIDTLAMEFRLPADKIVRLKSSILVMLRRCKVLLRVLQSLLGINFFTSITGG